MLPTIEWSDGKVVMVDQRLLPHKEVYVTCANFEQVAQAIELMIIRGAPAIGVAAAFGLAMGFSKIRPGEDVDKRFQEISKRLEKTRPTARNLFWALERMKAVFEENRGFPLETLKDAITAEAQAIEKEDVDICRRIGSWGKGIIKDGDAVLTHCNAGELATAGFGTALGVIRAAREEGKKMRVFVDETRPFLQGARLTAWELRKYFIPFTLITDSMAGFLMQRGEITLAIAGADRIASNGDCVNKIGTYTVAVLAAENAIPFYIAAPTSTVDMSLKNGDSIPIEERHPDEVRKVGGVLVTFADAEVRNPAFDMTPARYIAGIITEHGIARPPYEKSLSELIRSK